MALSDDITKAYQQYLGREPDKGGLDYWTGITQTHGLDTALSGISGSDEAKSIGGNNTGEGNFEFDFSMLEDLFPSSESHSYTGLPDWATGYLQKILGRSDYGLENLMAQFPALFAQAAPNINAHIAQYKTDTLGDYNRALQGILGEIANQKGIALSDYTKAGTGINDLIEQTRTLMPKNYESSINYNMEQNLKPRISNLSGRGVLSSSVAADALGKVMQASNADYMDKVNQANTWASNARLGTSQEAQRYLAGLDADTANKILGALGKSQEFTSGVNKDVTEKYITNLNQNLAAHQKQLALLASLLDMSKYTSSSSESSNPLAPWSDMLPYLM